ncbi:hypothetical protein P154DRAFT_616428 [Amniculicola lignicola CBS 123094]|uniref:Mid2 domain-containing protein n=1 Tax=Amniculicola lignicola CBS 123094 TaxID=1392246 RepID=A0A6A5WTP2_9PLEO|nr:hypothetical protein P154DRAFT_616428 [Amniculicola lignicola CBS 123094]
MRGYKTHISVALLLCCVRIATSAPNFQEKLLITFPPTPAATNCPNTNLLKRQQSCQFGQCGTECLSQGAFCCGPAGTLATSPYWVCDNGACITSVRGTTGIVDCYDPDNPSGTTQSCLDYQRTSSCRSTDRCYTCSADFPFCRWETYVSGNGPSLSWFSCVETKLPDTTFLGATITTNLPALSRTATAEATKTSSHEDGLLLSTGAIIGIAAGGGVVIIGIIALLVYCCLKKRSARKASQQLGVVTAPVKQEVPQQPQELDSHQYTRSELNFTGTTHSPYSEATLPFSSPQDYARQVEEVDMWRRETVGYPAAELPAKNMSYAEPREVHTYGQGGGMYVQDHQGQQYSQLPQRDSWACGDDTGHMSPGSRG